MSQLVPASNTTARVLRQLKGVFNEAVTGVNAADLLANGMPATSAVEVPPDENDFRIPAALAITDTTRDRIG